MPARPVTVPTTVVQLAGDNPRRSVLAFFNLGANTIFISQDRTSVTGNGYPVLSNSQIVLMAVDGDEPQTEWWAQALVGSNDVRVFESYQPFERVREVAA